MDKQNSALMVQSTFSSFEDAQSAANKLIEKRLAACGQVSQKIHSVYWWKGAIESSDEYILNLKTREDLFEDLRVFLKEIHPYETPEIIASRIMVEASYLQWLIDETTKQD